MALHPADQMLALKQPDEPGIAQPLTPGGDDWTTIWAKARRTLCVGAQDKRMARESYENETVFSETIYAQ